MALPHFPPVPPARPEPPASVAEVDPEASGLPTMRPGLPTAPPIPAITTPAITTPAITTPTGATSGTSSSGQVPLDVRGLTAHDLLTGTADQFAHLDERIVKVREWVQEYLSGNRDQSDAVARARQDPAQRAQMADVLDRLLLQYLGKASVARGRDRDIIVASVINEVLGLGPIEPLWTDRRITEVMVNGPLDVRVEIEGKVVPVPGARFRDAGHLLEVCTQILMPLNRRVDQKNPLADGRLPDGSRVNVVHPAIAPGGPYLTIRRFPETTWTLSRLIEVGSVTEQMACELAFLVQHKCSLVVVGGTGTGKTTLLNALSSAIPRNERVLTVEDSLELRMHPQAHVLALEARPASASGEGEVKIRDLVRNALRMRPDRLVVGEVRDSAALDMLQAMNTGHEGSMTTVHANGAAEAINRLSVLVATGGDIPGDKVQWLIGDAVDLMVVQTRYEDGSRRVSGVYEVPTMQGSADRDLLPIPLWEWRQTGTSPAGKFVGEYVHCNPVSDALRAKRRLDQFPPLTMQEIHQMSQTPHTLPEGTS